MTAVADAELGLYVEDCLSRVPEVRLIDNSATPYPHLIVTDRPQLEFELGLSGVARLHVMDEDSAFFRECGNDSGPEMN